MRFEKISDDVIKVNVSAKDLVENHINSNEVMSNPTESQSLFLAVLEQAEKDIGFNTNDYSLKVETIALEDGTFLLTITRTKDYSPSDSEDNIKEKFKSDTLLYEFDSFDTFVEFVTFIKSNRKYYNKALIKDSKLYKYNDKYYLEILDINLRSKILINFYSTIIEFASLVPTQNMLYKKIYEYGAEILNSHAINTAYQYFS